MDKERRREPEPLSNMDDRAKTIFQAAELRPILHHETILRSIADPSGYRPLISHLQMASRIPIVKKRTKVFKRHQSDRYHGVKEAWRKPKGESSLHTHLVSARG